MSAFAHPGPWCKVRVKRVVKDDHSGRPEMTVPAVADRVHIADDAAAPLRGWQLVVALARVICVLLILLSAFARDSVRYWLRHANGPALTYRQPADPRS
jgi:hypothetical protein